MHTDSAPSIPDADQVEKLRAQLNEYMAREEGWRRERARAKEGAFQIVMITWVLSGLVSVLAWSTGGYWLFFGTLPGIMFLRWLTETQLFE